MYERFSDRARKVMQLANKEAQHFNHEYIGTEHILLGLVSEGTGIAANVLHNLNIDLHKVRREVESIVLSGPDDFISKGRRFPQTPRAKKVVEYAIEESRNLGHNYVGTEHLLLGLLREQEGVAAQVLMNLGLRLQDVRNEILSLFGQKPETGIVDLGPRPLALPRETSSDIDNLPDHARKIALEFEWQIEQLQREKEAAITYQDFEKAAKLAEHGRQLARQRELFIAEWRGERSE